MANELAQNEDVQRKLQNEIDETIENLDGKELTYDALMKMKYLDMVISGIYIYLLFILHNNLTL